ncbi:MAG: glycoside hydrolase family 15 protein [Thermoplasmataceae archaeon]
MRELLRFDQVEVKGFPLIRNHGMIANNTTAALVAANGKISWACLPIFSSPPVFDCILDSRKGTFFQICPSDSAKVMVNQTYIEKTPILRTSFFRDNKKILEITDFIPESSYENIRFPEIHRIVNTFEEPVEVLLRISIRSDYNEMGSVSAKNEHGFIISCNDRNIGCIGSIKIETSESRVDKAFSMEKDSQETFIVAYGLKDIPDVSDFKSDELLQTTIDFWTSWSNECKYSGQYLDQIMRSALTLRGLFYEPTGLMVAAPTTSLPECIGGMRNWDYRFSWLRDTAYVIEALSLLGYHRYATKFLYDMMEIIEKEGKIRTIYPINLMDDITEITLDYEGYLGSKPVRIGNLASNQLQLDEYGSIINAIYHLCNAGGLINAFLRNFIIETIDKIVEKWSEPDSSIWEFRTEKRHYVYSKVMCWMGIDRAIKIGKAQNFSFPYEKWESTRDQIKQDILKNGFNRNLNSFVQYYGSDDVDASLLRIPTIGFLDGNNEMIKGTIAMIEKKLMHKNFLFSRYLNDDGISCKDNPFLLLSFWYAEALMEIGRVEDAKSVYETIMGFSNDLGLFSEEIDLETMEMIGNFPQAITHIGVIRVGVKLGKL